MDLPYKASVRTVGTGDLGLKIALKSFFSDPKCMQTP